MFDKMFSRINLTLFVQISVPGACLVSKILKEGGVYFKVRVAIHMKFQKFMIFFSQITINNYH